MTPEELLPIVQKYSKQYGVDQNLILKILAAESSGDVNAESAKRAQGLMQLMPGTAAELGVVDPFDPDQNIKAGTQYYSQMLKKYNNPRTALAAYNFGPGNIDAGKPWPQETINHVNKVFGVEQPVAAAVASPEKPPLTSVAPPKATYEQVVADPEFSKFSPDAQVRIVSRLVGPDAAKQHASTAIPQMSAGTGITEMPTGPEAFTRIMEASGLSGVMDRLMGKGPETVLAPPPDPTPTIAEDPLNERDAATAIRGLGQTAAVGLAPMAVGAAAGLPAVEGAMAATTLPAWKTVLAGLGLGAAGAGVGHVAGGAVGEAVGLPETGAAVGEQIGAIAGGVGGERLVPAPKPVPLNLEQQAGAYRSPRTFLDMLADSLGVPREALVGVRGDRIQTLAGSNAGPVTGRTSTITPDRAAPIVPGQSIVPEVVQPEAPRAIEVPAQPTRGRVIDTTAQRTDVQPSEQRLVKTPQEVAAEGASGEVNLPPSAPTAVEVAPAPADGRAVASRIAPDNVRGEPTDLPGDEAASKNFLEILRRSLADKNNESLREAPTATPVVAGAPQATSGVTPTPPEVSASSGAPQAASEETAQPAELTARYGGQEYRVGDLITSGGAKGKYVAEIDAATGQIITSKNPPAAKVSVDAAAPAPYIKEGEGDVAPAEGLAPSVAGGAEPSPAYAPPPREIPEGAPRRKKIAEMNEDEMRQALAEDRLTGLGSKLAYEDAERLPVQSKWDAEGLKATNDNLGDEAGNQLLRAVGTAFREEGLTAYRMGGDEFVTQHMTHEEAADAVARVKARLQTARITATLPDGTVQEYEGIGLHHGAGDDYGKADTALREAKKSAVAAGERAERGVIPTKNLRPVPRAVDQVSAQGDEASGAPPAEGEGTELAPRGGAEIPKGQSREIGEPQSPSLPKYSVKPNELGFYSQLERGAADPKAPKAAKGADWAQFLSDPKRGVKKDEMRWTGLDDFLDARRGEKVTKEEIQEYLKNNQVEVKELTKGVKEDSTLRDKELREHKVEEVAAYQKYLDDRFEIVKQLADAGYGPDEAARMSNSMSSSPQRDYGQYRSAEEKMRDPSVIEAARASYLKYQALVKKRNNLEQSIPAYTPPKYAQYQLPGGQNYREVLLQLPVRRSGHRSLEDINADLRSVAKSLGVDDYIASGWRPNGGRFEKLYQDNPEFRKLRDEWDAAVAGRSEGQFTGGHWGEPNVMAHFRLTDRVAPDGKKVLFAEEVQGDWPQRGRQAGFKGTPEEAAVARGAVAEAKKAYDKKFAEIADLKPTLIIRDNPEMQHFDVVDQDGTVWTTTRNRSDAQDYVRDMINRKIKAYANRDEAMANPGFRKVAEDLDKASKAVYALESGVPRAPYVEKTEDWTALVMRRLLRMAAEGGYDRVSWTTGEQQVDRWQGGLRKAVDKINWKKTDEGVHLVGMKHGSAVVNTTEKETALSDAIGKAMSDQILSSPEQSGTIEGDNIKISDTGMAGFYDKILPKVAEKVAKKWGAKVESAGVGDQTQAFKDWLVQKATEAEADGLYASAAVYSRMSKQTWSQEQPPFSEVRAKLNRVIKTVNDSFEQQAGRTEDDDLGHRGEIGDVRNEVGAYINRGRAHLELTLRPFTQGDWNGYNGAEKFPDGYEPLVGNSRVTVQDGSGKHQVDVEVIVDAHGVQVIGGDEGEHMFDLRREFNTQSGADMFMQRNWSDPESTFWQNVEDLNGNSEIHPAENNPGFKAHSIDLTPEMKEGISKEGFPQFALDKRKLSPLGFYSKLRETVEDPRTPASGKATDIARFLADPKRGVKAAELKWTGLTEYLQARGDEKVTKQDLLKYLDEHQVEVKEVQKGGRNVEVEDFDAYYNDNRIADYREQLTRGKTENPDYDVDLSGGKAVFIDMGTGEPIDIKDLPEDLQVPASGILGRFNALKAMFSRETRKPTKYGQYTLPGGENYREVVLTLPEKPRVGVYEARPMHPNAPKDDYWGIYLKGKDENLLGAPTEKTLAQGIAKKWTEQKGSYTPPGRFTGGHMEEPNALGWFRLKDRTDADGKKVLFVEEMQTDWGQKARREGIQQPKDTTEFKKQLEYQKIRLKDLLDTQVAKELEYGVTNDDFTKDPQRFDKLDYKQQDDLVSLDGTIETSKAIIANLERKISHPDMGPGVADAPFIGKTEDWSALMVKRILRMAAEEGYDRVAWTTGEQQSERYDLSKHIDKVIVTRLDSGHLKGQYAILASKHPSHDPVIDDAFPAEKLPDVVGKELADKIINNPESKQNYSGLDLKVGGEGMRGFYDKIIPATVEKVGKQWGVKVKEGRVGISADVSDDPPEDLVNNSSWMPYLEQQYHKVIKAMRDGMSQQEAIDEYASPHLQEMLGDRVLGTPGKGFKAHSIDITPEMRDSITSEGFSQFRMGEVGGDAGKITLEAVRANLPEGLPQRIREVDGKFVLNTPAGSVEISPVGEVVLNWSALEAGHGGEAVAGVKAGAKKIIGSTVNIGPKAYVQIVQSGALPHEFGGHVYLDHFATPKEKEVITKALGKAAEAEGRSVDEVFADGYSDWFEHDREGREEESLIKRIYRRIYEFFAGIYHSVFPSVEGIYRDVARGKPFERNAADAGGESEAAASVGPTRAVPKEERNANLKKWFGESKVVDENGEPLPMYHGTAVEKDFSIFKGSKDEVGMHFGNVDQATNKLEWFWQPSNSPGKDRIYKVFLKIENPLRVGDTSWQNDFGNSSARAFVKTLIEDHPGVFTKENTKDIRSLKAAVDLIKSKGYDGLVYENVAEGAGDSYAVFEPNQIKSATGNAGTFSPETGDIRYSVKDDGPPPPAEGTPDAAGKKVLEALKVQKKPEESSVRDRINKFLGVKPKAEGEKSGMSRREFLGKSATVAAGAALPGGSVPASITAAVKSTFPAIKKAAETVTLARTLLGDPSKLLENSGQISSLLSTFRTYSAGRYSGEMKTRLGIKDKLETLKEEGADVPDELFSQLKSVEDDLERAEEVASTIENFRTTLDTMEYGGNGYLPASTLPKAMAEAGVKKAFITAFKKDMALILSGEPSQSHMFEAKEKFDHTIDSGHAQSLVEEAWDQVQGLTSYLEHFKDVDPVYEPLVSPLMEKLRSIVPEAAKTVVKEVAKKPQTSAPGLSGTTKTSVTSESEQAKLPEAPAAPKLPEAPVKKRKARPDPWKAYLAHMEESEKSGEPPVEKGSEIIKPEAWNDILLGEGRKAAGKTEAATVDEMFVKNHTQISHKEKTSIQALLDDLTPEEKKEFDAWRGETRSMQGDIAAESAVKDFVQYAWEKGKTYGTATQSKNAHQEARAALSAHEPLFNVDAMFHHLLKKFSVKEVQEFFRMNSLRDSNLSDEEQDRIHEEVKKAIAELGSTVESYVGDFLKYPAAYGTKGDAFTRLTKFLKEHPKSPLKKPAPSASPAP